MTGEATCQGTPARWSSGQKSTTCSTLGSSTRCGVDYSVPVHNVPKSQAWQFMSAAGVSFHIGLGSTDRDS